MGRAAMILVVGAFGLVGCSSGATPVKETVYVPVPVPVEEQEDPLEELRERRETAVQVCEDLGGRMDSLRGCILPEPEVEEPAYVPADPCRLPVHRQLNPDECAGYVPDFP